MAAPNSCDPCGCIPGNISNDVFKQSVLDTLCQIISNTSGGGASSAVNLIQVGGANITLGQALMAASIPVVIASNQSTLPVSFTAAAGNLTDGSGTITTGGTAQTIFALNASRKYLYVQNQSTGNLWINFGTNAVQGQPSILITPNGASFVMEASFLSGQSVTIIGATTGQAFTAKQG